MTSETVDIIKPPVLIREQAFNWLRNAIITGKFEPGTRLVERKLCEAMGVSRTSVREVLRRLEAERLVNVEPRRGPTVANLSRKQAAEIYEIRANLEAILFRRFTEIATDEQVRTLRSIADEIAPASDAGDIAELIAIMTRLLGYVMEVVDHEIINDILKQLIARVSVLRAISMAHPGRIQQSPAEIQAIIEAVERRDPDAAARASSTYIGNARDAALRRYDNAC